MAINTNALMTQALCVSSCIPQGMQLAVLIALLAPGTTTTGSITSSMGNTCSTTAVQTDATALAANSARRMAKIRNLSTDSLYIQLGAGCTTVIGGFWEKLPGADAQDDWDNSYYVDITNYTGVVTVAGENLRYIATEIYEA